MARTHPPSLLTLTTRTLRDARLIEPGDVVLLAVSGGPDSMALLHVMARLRAKLGFTIVAHGVDHGLRPAASSELDRAEAFARTLDVPFTRTELALSAGGNLQARARAARYEALNAAAARAGASRIATAHHADDRAETVLLRLLRGAGPAGLAVLPPRAGNRIRPFLHASSAAIRAHVARHAIPHALDPSNDDPRFMRVRVRHEVMPLLRALSPHITEHLCALADQLVDARARGMLEPADTPPAPRPLARATRVALADLASRASEKRRVLLPGGLVAAYDRTQLRVVVRSATDAEPRADGAKPLSNPSPRPSRGSRPTP